MGNKLTFVSKWRKRSNEEKYERLLPEPDSEGDGSYENMEALEQFLQEAPKDAPLQNLEPIEQFPQRAPKETPLDHLERLEKFLREVSKKIPIENIVPPEQFASFEKMEGTEQFRQETAGEISFKYTEPPEQPLRGAPNDIPLIDFGSPEHLVLRAPVISFHQRFFQCFPTLNDQEEFSGEVGMLNDQGFRGEVDLLRKRVPIEFVFTNDSISYITHFSTYNGLVKEGMTWRLLDKILDVTIIKSTRPFGRSKYFNFQRDPTDNKWVLYDSHPYKNEYQGKRFSALILGVTATYLRDNIEYHKYVNLTQPPVIDVPPDAMEPVQYVVHITTYDILLEKKTDQIFFRGRHDGDETEYYIRKRSPRSFTPNFFSRNNANAAAN